MRNPFEIIYTYLKKKDPVPLERVIVIEDDIANGIKRTEYVLKTTDSKNNNHNITFYENKLSDYAYEPYIDDDWDILNSPDVSGAE